jgi:demethylmenaquinone methyltransferase / 2-methoxy-6-polyprenyl-1,4-benzoquinol methylase
MSGPNHLRREADGSPHPDRGRPGFENELQEMFGHIADRYALINHVATFGPDYLWRPRALWALDRYRGRRPVGRILDFGCGPGDFTLLAATHYPTSTAVGADFTAGMLRKARQNTRAHPGASRISYVRADVGHLPFEDASFDLVLSAFVVRNLPDLHRAFSECRRVLRPSGSMVTLEVSEPEDRVVRDLFHAYFDNVVPWLGAAFSSAGPHRYLPESLKYLPDRPAMAHLMQDAGFVRTEVDTQSMGIVSIFLASVPDREAGAGPKP